MFLGGNLVYRNSTSEQNCTLWQVITLFNLGDCFKKKKLQKLPPSRERRKLFRDWVLVGFIYTNGILKDVVLPFILLINFFANKM